MMTNTDTLFSMTQADQNCSAVARSVDRNGEAVIMENEDFILDLTEEERFDIVTRRVLEKYLPAFKELAK